MQITKLEYQKKFQDRVNVFVDGKFAVGLGANDIIKLGLFTGQEISQGELNKIIASSSFGKAFNAAVNFLSFRPRSEWEIRQYLKRKKYEDIDGVVEKLRDIGQINDEEFAKWWVEQRSTFRPKGKRAIDAELRLRGVKTTIEIDEKALALKALQKKLPLARDKAFRYLVGRGFSYETVESVIEKLGLKE